MVKDLTSEQGQKLTLNWLMRKAAAELKDLLEKKHLYQRVDISPMKEAGGHLDRMIPGPQQQHFLAWLQKGLPNEMFVLADQQISAVPRGATMATARLTLALPHASIFCKTCERRETFVPVWFVDISNEINVRIASGLSKRIVLPEGFQTFLLAYQCQRCLGTPESFLVRRDGWILGLHGRSPMEQIEVPSYIPKTESHFYRDAVIAFNSGKTLAALFYLRTFIEQFGRRLTGLTGKATGEEIFEAYNKTLPVDVKGRIPSLREWYDKLSEAIHSAREDRPLFEAAKPEIETHFDIRRVFKIPGAQAPVEEKMAGPEEATPSANESDRA